MNTKPYDFTRVRTAPELIPLMRQTAWDYYYWPELDNDLDNEIVMDLVVVTGEYRTSLDSGFVVREEPVIGVYVVSRAELEQQIGSYIQRLERAGLFVYTVVAAIPLKAEGGYRLVNSLITHVRHGATDYLRAPLKLPSSVVES